MMCKDWSHRFCFWLKVMETELGNYLCVTLRYHFLVLVAPKNVNLAKKLAQFQQPVRASVFVRPGEIPG